jgi:site-specific DNA-methyltransferase (adenine-specific)
MNGRFAIDYGAAVDREAMAGTLYCGDNLEVLTEYVPDESVDLIYLDPPFNSKRTYNIVYKDSRAQEEAFKDHWSWEEVAGDYERLVGDAMAPARLRKLIRALHEQLIDEDSDLLAYLTMMAPRFVALHRVLKPTGSIYLHCDPTASHYLKILMDAVFSSRQFLSEVIWQRCGAHGDSKRYGAVHDVLLFYGKTENATFVKQFVPYAEDYSKARFKQVDEHGRRYQDVTLRSPSPRPNLTYAYEASNGLTYHPHPNGWSCDRQRMQQLDDEGRLRFPMKANGRLRLKMFLDESPGVALHDVWTDIPLSSTAKERLGFPTQKPLALLDRIIQASSTSGALVLDPFCGCGTTIEASERLGRRWIGIDIAVKAVEVTQQRFERLELKAPDVVWHPVGPEAAVMLGPNGKDFERWVLRRIRAARLRKHDRGIDGEAHFREQNGTTRHVVISVKGVRKPNPSMVRELRGTLEREKADIGVFVCLPEPSAEMRHEAIRAGHLDVSDSEGPIPRLQIVTVDRLFSNYPSIRCPGVNVTTMPIKAVPVADDQLALDMELTTQKPANDQVTRRASGTTPELTPKPPVKTRPPAASKKARRRR